MSTYTVNIIHMKLCILQIFTCTVHSNITYQKTEPIPKSKVIDIVIVIGIIVAVKCHSHPEPAAAMVPTFPSPATYKVIQKSYYRATSCKHPRSKLPSGKLPRRRNLANSSLHKKELSKNSSKRYQKLYHCCI